MSFIFLIIVAIALYVLYQSSDNVHTLAHKVLGKPVAYLWYLDANGSTVDFSSPVLKDGEKLFVYRYPATKIRRYDLLPDGTFVYNKHSATNAKGTWSLDPVIKIAPNTPSKEEVETYISGAVKSE